MVGVSDLRHRQWMLEACLLGVLLRREYGTYEMSTTTSSIRVGNQDGDWELRQVATWCEIGKNVFHAEGYELGKRLNPLRKKESAGENLRLLETSRLRQTNKLRRRRLSRGRARIDLLFKGV